MKCVRKKCSHYETGGVYGHQHFGCALNDTINPIKNDIECDIEKLAMVGQAMLYLAKNRDDDIYYGLQFNGKDGIRALLVWYWKEIEK